MSFTDETDASANIGAPSSDPLRRRAPSLRAVQQWMQNVIANPDGVLSGAASTAAKTAIGSDSTSIEDLILPSSQLSSRQRLEVYANTYYARLLEVLSEEYPALTHLLGEETFNAFAFDYLQFYPSQSYTLADLGSNFHRFLIENRSAATAEGSDQGIEPYWLDLMIDLAAIERTYSEVFSGPGIEGMETLNSDTLSAVEPEQVGELTLRLAPCVRLLRLRSGAHEYAIAVRKGTASRDDLPRMNPTFLVVTRLRYVVRTIAVEELEFELLELLSSNVSLGEAIAKVAETSSLDDEQLTTFVAAWFQKWASDRLFLDFQLPSQ